MTGLIAIDEAGDLGSAGTRYFTMVAIVLFRSRDLKKAAASIPNDNIEHKWNNSTPERRFDVLKSMTDQKFKIVYVVVDKNHPNDHHPVYGNELYVSVLERVISDAMDCLPCKDTNVYLDRCSFLTSEDFRNIVYRKASEREINPLKVHMISSSDNKCIQLADFIAGACRSYYEYGDDSFNVIKEKVSFARRR